MFFSVLPSVFLLSVVFAVVPVCVVAFCVSFLLCVRVLLFSCAFSVSGCCGVPVCVVSLCLLFFLCVAFSVSVVVLLCVSSL